MNISLDCEDFLECDKCENNLLTIKDVEIVKNDDGIDNITINFVCVQCSETIHPLNMRNVNGSTHISWKTEENHYAKVINTMFKK